MWYGAVATEVEEKIGYAESSPYVEIPDTAFLYALIEEGVDTDGDSLISYGEAEEVNSLDVDAENVCIGDSCWYQRQITTLEGIEAFVNLDTLHCSNSLLTRLDLTKNTALKVVWLGNNQLSNLDVSTCTDLKFLFCRNNEFTNLDVSNNVHLSVLIIDGNHLTSLDVSTCIDLEELWLGDNELTNLDVSNNKHLQKLMVESNYLTSLDVSNNTALNVLRLGNNQLSTLDVSENTFLTAWCPWVCIAALELSNMTTLHEVCVWDGFVPDTGTYLSGVPPEVTLIDTAGSPNVYFTTECFNDMIVFIPDTAFLNALILVGVDINQDSLISYTEAEAVTSLIIDTRGGYACGENNNISSLVGIEAFINLDTLLCTCGKVEDLDLSGNQKLKYLNCSENNLRNLDVSSNTMLSELHCRLNQLSNLDLSNNLELQKLDCWANDLSEIDVSNNVNLTFLDISANQIKELDVSNNIALTELRCESNELNTLDITNNILLTGLYCGFNEIASLDISNNTLLTYMWLVGMPYLNEVCVWEIPFPPAGVEVNRYQSPNIYYTVECATSIEKRDRVNVSIFPNPTMKLLTVETSNSNQYHFEITSLNGQLIFSTEMEGTNQQIDLSSFQKGVYFITIRSIDFVTTRKIVKL